ncbi:hypothetical protein C6Y14_30335 [Streptomyces dioscori]|uniref:Uncharacterized protein n=2 Tax=Streptomyces dioscori TaxID=2109333 RepID=A0A2P8Q0L2_9ACTN|nr:hypothetical protein C6Y14_30335 [Streptomyces dioscori]
MAVVAAEALARGPREPHPADLTHGPVVADRWTDGPLGFVLLLHRRDDGFVAGELYHSLRTTDGSWTGPDPLSGGVLGFDPTDPASVEAVLSGAALRVVPVERGGRPTATPHDGLDLFCADDPPGPPPGRGITAESL